METLNRVAFQEIVEEDGEPCLVIFSRKSCHVCQAVHGKLDNLEGEYPDVPFYEVDVETDPELQSKFSLKGVPHVLFFKDGEVQGRLTGNNDEDDYAEKIEELL